LTTCTPTWWCETSYWQQFHYLK